MVSVILPVYNARKYIRKALDSIINQTYKDFEIIIIDDGATDGTSDICIKYARIYDNIRYITQCNSGVCKARNKGISEARGEYITFCDHDDEYEPTYLEEMIKFCQANNLDMVKCGARFIDIDREDKIHSEHFETFNNEILGNEELVNNFLSLSTAFFDVWNGMYNTEFLRKTGISFDSQFVYGMEDYDFNTRIIPFIKKIGFMKKNLYIHYMRMNQSTSGMFKEERIVDVIKYQNITCKTFEKYKGLLEKDWAALSFGKNLVGIIKYSKRGNIGMTKTLDYIRFYTKCLKRHLDSINKINYNYKKYSFVAVLAKYRQYKLIYILWMMQYYVREIFIKIKKK